MKSSMLDAIKLRAGNGLKASDDSQMMSQKLPQNFDLVSLIKNLTDEEKSEIAKALMPTSVLQSEEISPEDKEEMKVSSDEEQEINKEMGSLKSDSDIASDLVDPKYMEMEMEGEGLRPKNLKERIQMSLAKMSKEKK